MKTNPVKSRFAVPAAIALAGHAILLFGFRSPHVVEPSNKTDRPIDTTCIFRVPPEPPEPSEGSTTDTVSSTNSGPSGPTQPDIPTEIVPPGSIAVPAELNQATTIDIGMRTISPGPPGIGHIGEPGLHILRRGDLDNTPKATFQARPLYPYSMRQTGTPGEVVVDFLVDEQGNVRDVHVVRSTHRDFEEATIRAVSQWKFEPGKRQGRPVRFRMAQSVGFTLAD